MKKITRGILGLALGGALMVGVFAAETDRPGQVDFGKLVPSAHGEFVEVNISGNLLGIAARLAAKQEPDVAELLRGLQSVRVNVLGLDDLNRSVTDERIKTLRTELDAKGWERVVTVKEKAQDVGVFIKTRGQETVEGLVVTVIEGNQQAVLVNIVGAIQVEQIAKLADKLHLDPLKKVAEAIEKK